MICPMRCVFASARSPTQGGEAVDELALGLLTAFAVGDLQPPREEVVQHAVGLQARVRESAPEQQPEALGMDLERVLQFVQQSALAQPGLADDRERTRRAPCDDVVDHRDKARQLGVAAHHRWQHALDAA